jgi:glycine hydroxymethyltransferase
MNFNDNLSYSDKELFNLINKEESRQEDEIELIASENYASKAVLEAMASSLNNKYSEGYSGKRYYGGNQVIDEIEALAKNRLEKLYSADHANVQPLSGSPANAAVYMAFLNPGDKVLGLRLDHGGHLSHGHKVNFSGKLYNFVQYGLGENGYIDMDEVRSIALQERPKMIVAGFSAYSRDIDWERFKEIADEVGAYTFADIAHIAGLIAGGFLSSPVPFFDVVSSTTHKTLRGPRGAFILCKGEFAQQVDRAVFPGMQGGPHNHITAAKAVAFNEASSLEFKDYCRQTLTNAKTMAERFIELGYNIISGGTDNHLMIIDLRNINISGLDAEKTLERAGISVSRSTIPNDPAPPMKPSGIRIGTPAVTTRGFKEKEILELVKLIDLALKSKNNEETLGIIKERVSELCKKFPIYKKQ